MIENQPSHYDVGLPLYCECMLYCVFHIYVSCGGVCILMLPAKGPWEHISCFADSGMFTFVPFTHIQ